MCCPAAATSRRATQPIGVQPRPQTVSAVIGKLERCPVKDSHLSTPSPRLGGILGTHYPQAIRAGDAVQTCDLAATIAHDGHG